MTLPGPSVSSRNFLIQRELDVNSQCYVNYVTEPSNSLGGPCRVPVDRAKDIGESYPLKVRGLANAGL